MQQVPSVWLIFAGLGIATSILIILGLLGWLYSFVSEISDLPYRVDRILQRVGDLEDEINSMHVNTLNENVMDLRNEVAQLRTSVNSIIFAYDKDHI